LCHSYAQTYYCWKCIPQLRLRLLLSTWTGWRRDHHLMWVIPVTVTMQNVCVYILCYFPLQWMPSLARNRWTLASNRWT
jgi:hypothetical protein